MPRQRRSGGGRKIKDISGEVHSSLTAIRFSHISNGVTFWEFECVCGNKKAIAVGDVRKGSTKSCGCKRRIRERLADPEKAARRNKFMSDSRMAKQRGYEWSLTEDEFNVLTMLPCAVCGVPPRQKHVLKHKTLIYACLYNGIDRVDNTLGYISDNVRPCCITCNQAKHTKTEKDFQLWGQRFIEFQSVKNISEYGLSEC